MRECQKCNGDGKRKKFSFSENAETCSTCDGIGFFAAPCEYNIRQRVTTRKGFRASAPKKFASTKNPKQIHPEYWRAYYVWRIARFHGGIDNTMPIKAETMIDGDPYRTELEAIACAMAKEFFSTDMAGALTWGPLLGLL